jgi:serine/threonine protein kinase
MHKKAIEYEETNEVDMKQEQLEEPILFRDLVPTKVLGKGSYGVVQMVTDKNTGDCYALKRVLKQQVVDTSQQGHIMSEKEAMMTIKHPFLVRLFATYKSKEYLYFLMEPVLGGELFSYLRKRQMFSPKTTRFYSASVVLGFEYMHRKGMVYRDLKPENLLLTLEGYIKITDFGFAKKINDGSTWTLCGTPEYLAPEIVAGKGHGIAVDWWTLGVLIFEMLASFTPFYSSKRMKMYKKIVRAEVAFPSHFSSSSRSLISGLLARKASQRLGMIHGGADAIKNHQWYSGFDWKAMAQRKYKAPLFPVQTPMPTIEDAKNDPNIVPLEDPKNIENYKGRVTDWDADF